MHTSTLDEGRRLMLPVITKQTLYDDNQTYCFYINIFQNSTQKYH